MKSVVTKAAGKKSNDNFLGSSIVKTIVVMKIAVAEWCRKLKGISHIAKIVMIPIIIFGQMILCNARYRK